MKYDQSLAEEIEAVLVVIKQKIQCINDGDLSYPIKVRNVAVEDNHAYECTILNVENIYLDDSLTLCSDLSRNGQSNIDDFIFGRNIEDLEIHDLENIDDYLEALLPVTEVMEYVRKESFFGKYFKLSKGA